MIKKFFRIFITDVWEIIYSEHLLGYLAKVENFYNIEHGVLCETIDTILYKADENSVRHIFEAVNSIEIKEQKDLYEFAKLIVERMSLQIKKYQILVIHQKVLLNLKRPFLILKMG